MIQFPFLYNFLLLSLFKMWLLQFLGAYCFCVPKLCHNCDSPHKCTHSRCPIGSLFALSLQTRRSHLDWSISPSCHGGISQPSGDSLCQFLDRSPIPPNPPSSSIWVCSLNLVKHILQGLPEEGLMGTGKAMARPDMMGPPLLMQEAAVIW